MLFAYFLNRVTNMNQHVIAGREVFMLQHEQADFAFDAARFTGAFESGDSRYLHGDGETHETGSPLIAAISCTNPLRRERTACTPILVITPPQRLYVITLIYWWLVRA